jgi:hypothetical protein
MGDRERCWEFMLWLDREAFFDEVKAIGHLPVPPHTAALRKPTAEIKWQ